jgi:hypothetical protein
MIDHPAVRQPYPGGVPEYPCASSGRYGVDQEATGRREVTETNGDPREGRQIPNFELPDHDLLPFDLYQTLREGPLVFVFYRGDW